MSSTDDDVTRDWLGDTPRPDPLRAARASTTPTLPKRFYKEAGLQRTEAGYRLVLDGRGANTPVAGRSPCPRSPSAKRSPPSGGHKASPSTRARCR